MSERNTAIVLAAGQGKRMHSKVQKQFLEIQGYPVLYYSLRCFQESPLIQDIILVTGEESISYCKEEIVQKYGFTKVSAVIPGGKERYDSVYAGLCECRDCEYVLIHDGARPFVTEEILKRGLQKVKETGACVIGMPSKDTVKLSDEEGYVKETPNRKPCPTPSGRRRRPRWTCWKPTAPPCAPGWNRPKPPCALHSRTTQPPKPLWMPCAANRQRPRVPPRLSRRKPYGKRLLN